MQHASPSPTARRTAATLHAKRPPVPDWRQAADAQSYAPAAPWSDDLLSQFGLRMAHHGMSISRAQMRGSPAYALQQLVHARALGDDVLDLLVAQLFRCFEAHRSGVHTPTH